MALRIRVGSGGTGGSSSAADRGPCVVDARAHGVSSSAIAAINRVGLQAAIDAIDAGLPSNADNKGGIVYLPSGDPILIDRPVHLDRHNVKLEGEGSTRSRIQGTTGHDVLAVGIPRTPQGIVLNSANLPDLYTAGPSGTPLLDASAVTATGQRWGLRTGSIATGSSVRAVHAAQQGGPLDQGRGPDWYGATRKLTVSAAINFAHATAYATAGATVALFGIQDTVGPVPFSLFTISGNFILVYRTADATLGIDQGIQRSLTLGAVAAGTLNKVDFTINLDAGTVTAWLQGVQVTPAPYGGPALTAGLSFLANQHSPFGIGSASEWATDLNGTQDDLTFAGLKVTADALYTVGSAGSTIARVDGQTVNDYRRYFASESALVALLPLDEPPAVVAADRVLSVQGPDGQRTTAYVLDNVGHFFDSFNITGAAISRISLRGPDPRYGRAVALGGVYTFEIRNCGLVGGSHGIGALSVGSNYPVAILGCQITGRDAPIFLRFASLVAIRDCVFDHEARTYRTGVRLVQCNQVAIDRLDSPHFDQPEYFIKGVRSSFAATDVRTDNENPTQGSKIATFYASPTEDAGVSSCRLARVAEGYNGPDAYFVILDANGTHRGHFHAEDLSIVDTARPAVVRVIGAYWKGEVYADAPITQPWISDVSGNSPAKVVAVTW